MRQVITIDETGIMSGLQHKPGKGVDLRQFGPVRIERASEILWNEETQAWNIHLLCEPFSGKAVSTPDGSVLNFQNYDDAVTVEIVLLNEARLAGTLN